MSDAVTTVTSDMVLSVRFLYIDVSQSAIAQLVERMTVNHDVTGSSPVGGVDLRAGNPEKPKALFGKDRHSPIDEGRGDTVDYFNRLEVIEGRC